MNDFSYIKFFTNFYLSYLHNPKPNQKISSQNVLISLWNRIQQQIELQKLENSKNSSEALLTLFGRINQNRIKKLLTSSQTGKTNPAATFKKESSKQLSDFNLLFADGGECLKQDFEGKSTPLHPTNAKETKDFSWNEEKAFLNIISQDQQRVMLFYSILNQEPMPLEFLKALGLPELIKRKPFISKEIDIKNLPTTLFNTLRSESQTKLGEYLNDIEPNTLIHLQLNLLKSAAVINRNRLTSWMKELIRWNTYTQRDPTLSERLRAKLFFPKEQKFKSEKVTNVLNAYYKEFERSGRHDEQSFRQYLVRKTILEIESFVELPSTDRKNLFTLFSRGNLDLAETYRRITCFYLYFLRQLCKVPTSTEKNKKINPPTYCSIEALIASAKAEISKSEDLSKSKEDPLLTIAKTILYRLCPQNDTSKQMNTIRAILEKIAFVYIYDYRTDHRMTVKEKTALLLLSDIKFKRDFTISLNLSLDHLPLTCRLDLLKTLRRDLLETNLKGNNLDDSVISSINVLRFNCIGLIFEVFNNINLLPTDQVEVTPEGIDASVRKRIIEDLKQIDLFNQDIKFRPFYEDLIDYLSFIYYVDLDPLGRELLYSRLKKCSDTEKKAYREELRAYGEFFQSHTKLKSTTQYERRLEFFKDLYERFISGEKEQFDSSHKWLQNPPKYDHPLNNVLQDWPSSLKTFNYNSKLIKKLEKSLLIKLPIKVFTCFLLYPVFFEFFLELIRHTKNLQNDIIYRANAFFLPPDLFEEHYYKILDAITVSKCVITSNYLTGDHPSYLNLHYLFLKKLIQSTILMHQSYPLPIRMSCDIFSNNPHQYKNGKNFQNFLFLIVGMLSQRAFCLPNWKLPNANAPIELFKKFEATTEAQIIEGEKQLIPSKEGSKDDNPIKEEKTIESENQFFQVKEDPKNDYPILELTFVRSMEDFASRKKCFTLPISQRELQHNPQLLELLKSSLAFCQELEKHQFKPHFEVLHKVEDELNFCLEDWTKIYCETSTEGTKLYPKGVYINEEFRDAYKECLKTIPKDKLDKYVLAILPFIKELKIFSRNTLLEFSKPTLKQQGTSGREMASQGSIFSTTNGLSLISPSNLEEGHRKRFQLFNSELIEEFKILASHLKTTRSSLDMPFCEYQIGKNTYEVNVQIDLLNDPGDEDIYGDEDPLKLLNEEEPPVITPSTIPNENGNPASSQIVQEKPSETLNNTNTETESTVEENAKPKKEVSSAVDQPETIASESKPETQSTTIANVNPVSRQIEREKPFKNEKMGKEVDESLPGLDDTTSEEEDSSLTTSEGAGSSDDSTTTTTTTPNPSENPTIISTGSESTIEENEQTKKEVITAIDQPEKSNEENKPENNHTIETDPKTLPLPRNVILMEPIPEGLSPPKDSSRLQQDISPMEKKPDGLPPPQDPSRLPQDISPMEKKPNGLPPPQDSSSPLAQNVSLEPLTPVPLKKKPSIIREPSILSEDDKDNSFMYDRIYYRVTFTLDSHPPHSFSFVLPENTENEKLNDYSRLKDIRDDEELDQLLRWGFISLIQTYFKNTPKPTKKHTEPQTTNVEESTSNLSMDYHPPVMEEEEEERLRQMKPVEEIAHT